MSNFDENDQKYRMLWETARRSLKIYADSVSYQETISEKSTKDQIDETCTEYLIRVVSSSEKATQMKARRYPTPTLSMPKSGKRNE